MFKALLEAEEDRNLLIHFLNAVLGDDLAATIQKDAALMESPVSAALCGSRIGLAEE